MELQTVTVISILCIILQKTVFIQTHYTQPRFPQLHKVMERMNSESKQYVSGRTLPSSSETAAAISSSAFGSEIHAKTTHIDEDYDDDHIDEDDDEEEDEDDDEEDDEEDDDEREGRTIKGQHGHHPVSDGRPPWDSGRTTSTSRSNPIRTTPRSAPSLHRRHQPPAPQPPAPQPPAPQPPISSYSQFKWNTFGTPQGVDEYRNSRMNTNYKKSTQHTDALKAQEHLIRVNHEVRCGVPRAKVVNVKDIHPDPSKIFVPHCTVLHRCGNDTGCCSSDKQTCMAIKEHLVELYFISTTTTMSYDAGSRYSQHQPQASFVVKLLFSNHTECACRNKYDELMPRDMVPAPQRRHFQLQPSASASATTHRPHYCQPPPGNVTPTRSMSSNCRCPTEFYPRHLPNGSCTCDCFDKQTDCLRFKKGKEYFTHQDKSCIERKMCQMPQCEYGSYISEAGRCPTHRRQDKFTSWHPF